MIHTAARARFPITARRSLVALIGVAATLGVGVPAPTASSAQGGCSQPYKPMWIEVHGVGVHVDPWPKYPHDPPFWAGDVGQPGGPTMVEGMPPYTYVDGVLTVGEGDEQARFEGRGSSANTVAVLAEFEGRRYLSLQSTVPHGSFKAVLVYWDFDDPCRQLPHTSSAPTTPTRPPDAGDPPAGPAVPVSGVVDYTG